MCRNNKSLFLLQAGFALILSAATIPAQAAKGEFTYIGTVGGSLMLEDNIEAVDFEGIGLSTYHQLDYQALNWMAIGVGYGLNSYPAPEGFVTKGKLNYMLLAGRLLLPNQKPDAPVTPYLMGGAGIVPEADMGGPKQLMAGAGIRYDLDKKQGGPGIDLQACMTGFGPLTADFRIGLSLAFGGKKGASTTSSQTSSPAETGAQAVVPPGQAVAPAGQTAQPPYIGLVPTPTPVGYTGSAAAVQKLMDYTVVQGDTLWKIACKKEVYGDCELYPLVIAANRNILKSPTLVPGTVLKIVMNPTENTKAKARQAAWDDAWVSWRGVKITKEAYRAWKDKRSGTPKSAAPKPADGAGYKTEDFYTLRAGETLWAAACNKSTYGDCELYPLLVDANRDILKTPAGAKEGTLLRVKYDISEADKKLARLKAWTPEYMQWRGANVPKANYDAWKAKATAVAQPK